MEQLPDVVMVLLLIGVDVDTTTELRRDILHSISLLCRQLPTDPEDSVVRYYLWFRCPQNSLFLGDLHCQQGVGSHDNHLSLGPGTATVVFHQREPQLPSHCPCGRSSCSRWLNDLPRKFHLVVISRFVNIFRRRTTPFLHSAH